MTDSNREGKSNLITLGSKKSVRVFKLTKRYSSNSILAIDTKNSQYEYKFQKTYRLHRKQTNNVLDLNLIKNVLTRPNRIWPV